LMGLMGEEAGVVGETDVKMAGLELVDDSEA
jgi:hypothetical protein